MVHEKNVRKKIVNVHTLLLRATAANVIPINTQGMTSARTIPEALQAGTEQPSRIPVRNGHRERGAHLHKPVSQVIRAVWMNVGKSKTGHVMYKILKTLGNAGMSL